MHVVRERAIPVEAAVGRSLETNEERIIEEVVG
jgi:hypothetical protein